MTRPRGFALPLALVTLLVLSLLLVQALGGAAGDTALAANRQFRQSAFEAAEGGLVAARKALSADVAEDSPPLPVATDVLQVTHVADARPPSGYSLDRFVLQQLELRSTGRAARGATVTLVEGVDRVVLQP